MNKRSVCTLTEELEMPETSFSLGSDELSHTVTARPMTPDLRLSIASLVLLSTGHKYPLFLQEHTFFIPYCSTE